jgi:hypothetical protein
MMAHSSVSEIQEWGCYALRNLACNNDANRVSIASKHGIEAIVSALTAHSTASKVQEYGCLDLLRLTFNELEGGVAVLEYNPSNSYGENASQRIKALINLDPFVGFLSLQNLVWELGNFIFGRKR